MSGIRFIPAGAGNAQSAGARRAATPVHPRGCGERVEHKARFTAKAGSSPRVRGTPTSPLGGVSPARFIPAGAGNATAPPSSRSATPVHPRGCGERVRLSRLYGLMLGSSPRVRGTLPLELLVALPGRFIPAGAGNAMISAARKKKRAVHPRGCGERAGSKRRNSRIVGSSPRVRGTPRLDARRPGLLRFIPAGAGNASLRKRFTGIPPVHPRGCGERTSTMSRSHRKTGSSPRVRGTPVRPRPAHGRVRFIPAGAGNARAPCARAISCPVHPRGCGERRTIGARCMPIAGSSPRVRGTLYDSRPQQFPLRFIPAGAGNAQAEAFESGNRPVHPRGCGERPRVTFEEMTTFGSSPRVRGTLRRAALAGKIQRFIPAGAGNACSRAACIRARSVHPRGCGERGGLSEGFRQAGGSSPRVRGTPVHQHHRHGGGRFIPAGAGNAPPARGYPRPAAVHPRGCGERAVCQPSVPRPFGSSPRVRGTRAARAVERGLRRFIPAGAGNARRRTCWRSAPAVHPRGCGERRRRARRPATAAGSSPRVRGTRPQVLAAGARRRFIPAGAGNAGPSHSPGAAAAVHPRGCGERDREKTVGMPDPGSSPRVRGTRDRYRPPIARVRFIPAGAGNAVRPGRLMKKPSVHPRGCGERAVTFTRVAADDGSSPRVRGTPIPPAAPARWRRFIPAGAGNAVRRRLLERGAAVHPRGCGERLRDRWFVMASSGSSPRVRGTLAGTKADS